MVAQINGEGVDTINRDQRRLDESHDEMRFRMQGTQEYARWSRVFPDPLPSGCEYQIEWDRSGAMPVLVIQVIESKAPVKAAGKGEPAGDPEDDGDEKAESLTRKELNKLKREDLSTKAAELGIEFDQRSSNAMLVSLIIDKQKADQAARE